jgi:hypothetical protein
MSLGSEIQLWLYSLPGCDLRQARRSAGRALMPWLSAWSARSLKPPKAVYRMSESSNGQIADSPVYPALSYIVASILSKSANRSPEFTATVLCTFRNMFRFGDGFTEVLSTFPIKKI